MFRSAASECTRKHSGARQHDTAVCRRTGQDGRTEVTAGGVSTAGWQQICMAIVTPQPISGAVL